MTPDDMKAHPLVGKVVRWTHGPNVLVGPATHYDDEDDELFIVPDGLVHGHYWVPASECSPLAALSAHPAEETEWEYAEFDPAEIQEDGTIHEWAEPKDIWDKPLPDDELAELRNEGQVYASRRKPEPWRPVPTDGGAT